MATPQWKNFLKIYSSSPTIIPHPTPPFPILKLQPHNQTSKKFDVCLIWSTFKQFFRNETSKMICTALHDLFVPPLENKMNLTMFTIATLTPDIYIYLPPPPSLISVPITIVQWGSPVITSIQLNVMTSREHLPKHVKKLLKGKTVKHAEQMSNLFAVKKFHFLYTCLFHLLKIKIREKSIA